MNSKAKTGIKKLTKSYVSRRCNPRYWIIVIKIGNATHLIEGEQLIVGY